MLVVDKTLSFYLQNNVLDLWSLFDFLMPGFLGTERQVCHIPLAFEHLFSLFIHGIMNGSYYFVASYAPVQYT